MRVEFNRIAEQVIAGAILVLLSLTFAALWDLAGIFDGHWAIFLLLGIATAFAVALAGATTWKQYNFARTATATDNIVADISSTVRKQNEQIARLKEDSRRMKVILKGILGSDVRASLLEAVKELEKLAATEMLRSNDPIDAVFGHLEQLGRQEWHVHQILLALDREKELTAEVQAAAEQIRSNARYVHLEAGEDEIFGSSEMKQRYHIQRQRAVTTAQFARKALPAGLDYTSAYSELSIDSQ